MEFAVFTDPQVQASFDALAPNLRQPLLRLRQAILDVAAGTPQVGPLVETLKWGEPAYHPARPRIGTTIRINGLRGSDSRYALYVSCQTSLISSFQRHYPGEFVFEGKRALLFEAPHEIPAAPLRHCIALALTYHLKSVGIEDAGLRPSR